MAVTLDELLLFMIGLRISCGNPSIQDIQQYISYGVWVGVGWQLLRSIWDGLMGLKERRYLFGVTCTMLSLLGLTVGAYLYRVVDFDDPKRILTEGGSLFVAGAARRVFAAILSWLRSRRKRSDHPLASVTAVTVTMTSRSASVAAALSQAIFDAVQSVADGVHVNTSILPTQLDDYESQTWVYDFRRPPLPPPPTLWRRLVDLVDSCLARLFVIDALSQPLPLHSDDDESTTPLLDSSTSDGPPPPSDLADESTTPLPYSYTSDGPLPLSDLAGR